MFCGKCGKQIDDNAVFCSSCGMPASQAPSQFPGAVPPVIPGQPVVSGVLPTAKAPFETPALVFSIIGLVSCVLGMVLIPFTDDVEIGALDLFCLPLFFGAPALSITGMVLGIVGWTRSKGRSNPFAFSPQLVIGIILGVLGFAIWGIVVFLGLIGMLAEGV